MYAEGKSRSAASISSKYRVESAIRLSILTGCAIEAIFIRIYYRNLGFILQITELN